MIGDRNTSICGLTKKDCYNKAEDRVEDKAETYKAKCNCLPACTSIEYSPSIDHIEFDAVAVNKIRAFQTNDSEYGFAYCRNKKNINLNFFLIFF